jgi:hypothetical protein
MLVSRCSAYNQMPDISLQRFPETTGVSNMKATWSSIKNANRTFGLSACCTKRWMLRGIFEISDFGKMVRLAGVEPATSGSTIRRSNQLSYNRTQAVLVLNKPVRRGVTYGQKTGFASFALWIGQEKRPGGRNLAFISSRTKTHPADGQTGWEENAGLTTKVSEAD